MLNTDFTDNKERVGRKFDNIVQCAVDRYNFLYDNDLFLEAVNNPPANYRNDSNAWGNILIDAALCLCGDINYRIGYAARSSILESDSAMHFVELFIKDN